MKRIAILLFSLMLILSASLVQGQAVGPTLQVDANAAQHAINPNIYGMNGADPALADAVRLSINRWGGNATTRYNWENDTSNHASDWYFENIPNANANPGALPNGSSSDQFISDNIATNTQTLLTIPMIGWTPKSRGYDCGFSVTKYNDLPQQDIDPYRPDCGNGIWNDDTFVNGNDPTDTSLAINQTFVQAWMAHITSQFGAGAVRYYNLDNEPSLWNSTHRDVFPNGLSYDELRLRTIQYAAAIKAADPSALTLGPVEYGWTGYFYSGLDAAGGDGWWAHPADRLLHGDEPLVQWYLEQMKAYQTANGVRILDYLDLHYYPAADGVSLTDYVDPATNALRLNATRSLWDPTYIDESWIGEDLGEAVYLIPRMRDWVNTYYPGTKLAISEYNFGGLKDINGAITQADVLGIFGREGLDLATLWDPPAASEPGAYAFRMYRNYDGAGGGFGETSVSATSADQSALSIYAAKRADCALTLMIINKTESSLTSALNISNYNATTAQVYQYSAANLNQIVRATDVAVNGGSLTVTFPANSITLLVMKSGCNSLTLHYFTTPTPTLTWNPISWAVRYDVQIASDNGFSHDVQNGSVTPNLLSYPATTLASGTWYWRVRAVKTLIPLSVGAWSTPESFVVAP